MAASLGASLAGLPCAESLLKPAGCLRTAASRETLRSSAPRASRGSHTAVGPVSTTGNLITAIQNANTAGGLTPITLAANTTFDFTTANNSTNGHNALPVITGNVIIAGKGGDILSRDDKSTTAFRLFDVASGGSLILEDLTLQGGLVRGIGASAEGGAIYSSGALTLGGVTV